MFAGGTRVRGIGAGLGADISGAKGVRFAGSIGSTKALRSG